MPSYNPPVKAEAFSVRIGLEDIDKPGSFVVDPTIASGDAKIDIDGGGFANLDTLPSVSPAGSRAVLIELSATEMNGDVITVQLVDQTSPKQWADLLISIPTTA